MPNLDGPTGVTASNPTAEIRDDEPGIDPIVRLLPRDEMSGFPSQWHEHIEAMPTEAREILRQDIAKHPEKLSIEERADLICSDAAREFALAGASERDYQGDPEDTRRKCAEVHGEALGKLEKLEADASATVKNWQADLYAHQHKESAARQRVREAWGAGPKEILTLIEGVQATGDQVMLRQIARQLALKIDAAALADDRTERAKAQRLAPAAQALEASLVPAEVVQAQKTLQATRGAKQRLDLFRKVIRR